MNYLYTITSIVTLLLTFILALYVYSEDRKNRLNISFSLLTISATLWILANFLTDISREESLVMIWSKLALVGPVLIVYFFYRFSVFFPKTKEVKIFYDRAILFVASIFILLSPTSLNISKVFIGARGVPEIVPGFLYIPFLIYFSIIFIFSSRYIMKGYSAFTDTEKSQVRMVLSGISISAALGLLTNLILPLLGYSNFVNFGPYFILIFLALTAYTITRHHLFDIKVILAELFTFVVWVAVTTLAAMMDNLSGRILGGVVLVIVVIFGIFLIKYMKKVVALTEDLGVVNKELEQLAGRLKSVNRIMSHDIKNVLGKNKDMFGMLLEGTFGALSDHARGFLERVHDDTKKLIRSVIVILESGQELKLKLAPFGLKEAVLEVVRDTEPDAKAKGLALTTAIDEKETYTIVADRTQLVTHVLRNLIENAIHYTLAGTITVGLSKKDANTVLFSVKDTGIGIADEDKPNIFKEGGHGKDSIKVNVHSTGYGLYSVKRIVDAHGGKVWFETEAGKGTTFWVELGAK